MSNPRTHLSNNSDVLVPIPGKNPRTSQLSLEIKIARQREINGVGMGVLSNGTPYLTGRGLARLCGIDSSRISEITNDWLNETKATTRGIKNILRSRSVCIPDDIYVKVAEDNAFFHAYSDTFCLAVLEYYAFDAKSPQLVAQKNFRLLAGKALHDFIYEQVGYRVSNNVPEAWAQFHERVSLTYDSIPDGYFGIFKEIADIIVTLGNAGLFIDSSFVPDISVGVTWGKYWQTNNFDAKYGPRIKWEHNYPPIFPQSQSNPQQSWCYPEDALPEFRRWIRNEYIGKGKFSTYINSQIKKKSLPPSFAQIVCKAYALDT